MSSFATNTVFADDNLCPDELIEETVDVMNQALHEARTGVGERQDDRRGAPIISKFEKALSSYLSSTRHCASIGTDTRSMHARRQALLRSGKIDQAAALGRVKRPAGRDAS